MAHTEKTNPIPVKMRDGYLQWEEVHDHDSGPCTLPPVTAPDAFEWVTTRCYRIWQYKGRAICCCKMCGTPHLWHETKAQNHRRARAARKRADRKWEREYA